ncbi:MAG: hypothetical protein GVY29_09820 [Spirochaetes bacterium]|jgi:hypothetical protein|nr:hypothetical protein [Spirochaetota bacterium]
MRKATLLIAVLLCFGLATAFAGPVQVEPEYEAEASATWGIQLDDQASGFANSAESTIMFTFIEEQTAEYGEGTTYGYIEVEDFKVEFEAAGEGAVGAGAAFDINVGSITGKVMFGPAYLVVYDGADDAVDEIDHLGKINSDIITPTASVGVDPNVALDPTTEYGGVAVGFAVPDLVTVELGVASRSDWKDDGTGYGDADNYNEENSYVWSVNAEVTPADMVTVNLVSNMWYGKDGNAAGEASNPATVGLSAEYSMPLTEDIDLVPMVGYDLYTMQDAEEDQEMRMEFGGSVALIWPGLGLDEDDDDHIDFLPGDEEVTSGASLGAVYGVHPADFLGGDGTVDENVNTLALKLGFFEDGGDDGFLPIVGAAAMLNYNMVFPNEDAFAGLEDSKSDLGLGLELNADLGVVSPYAGMIYEVFDVAGNYDDATTLYPITSTYFDQEDNNNKNNFQVNVGTDINVIPNTTFTLDYKSGNLQADEDAIAGGASADDTYYVPFSTWGGSSMAGAFSVTTEISF